MANVNSEIRELREQMQNLSDIVQQKVKDKAKEALRDSEAKAERKVDGFDAENILHFTPKDLAAMAKKAGKDLRDFFEDKRDQAEEAYETVEKKITTHPMQAVAYAIGGGLLLGLLMRRK
jgi:ElaB/YqjD/DUF883 family membrane-anchored ribosome-binding protein